MQKPRPKAGDRLELHHLTSETLPIADASLDRISQNVMVYVDDPAHTFKEFRRVLSLAVKRTRSTAISLWSRSTRSPIRLAGASRCSRTCLRTPNIGRKFCGLAKAAGQRRCANYSHTRHKRAIAEFRKNIAGYAEAGTLDEQSISILDTAEAALEDGRYFAVNLVWSPPPYRQDLL